MAIEVVAVIANDEGKVLRFASGEAGTFTVRASDGDLCEWCTSEDEGKETPATHIIKGETDSYGWEPGYICTECLETLRNGNESYTNAEDIEDLIAPNGMLYIFNETTNIDRGHDWKCSSRSLRTVTAYMRRREDKAAELAGFYPDNGVRKVTYAEAREEGFDTCYYEEQDEAEAAAEAAKEEDDPRKGWSTPIHVNNFFHAIDRDDCVTEYNDMRKEITNSDDPVLLVHEMYKESRYPRGWLADICPEVQSLY